MLIEGFFGDHMFKQSMLLLVGILVCASLVYGVESDFKGLVIDNNAWKYVCYTANGYTYKINITNNALGFACSVQDKSDFRIRIECDSLRDGNGNGICTSGESCAGFDFFKENYSTIIVNSELFFWDVPSWRETLDENGYTHYKYWSSKWFLPFDIYYLTVNQEPGNTCPAPIIISTSPEYGSVLTELPLNQLPITIITDMNSTCRYSSIPAQDFDAMNTFDISDGISHSFQIIPENYKTYYYYIQCNSSLGDISQEYHLAFSTFLDSTPPVITNAYPFDNTIFYINRSNASKFIFKSYYIVGDTSQIMNCSLILNNQINQTDFTVEPNQDNSFEVANIASDIISPRYYNWSISCADALDHFGSLNSRAFSLIPINEQPIIEEMNNIPQPVKFGEWMYFKVTASDPDHDELTFTWYFDGYIIEEFPPELPEEQPAEEPVPEEIPVEEPAEEPAPDEVPVEELEEEPAEEESETSEEVEPVTNSEQIEKERSGIESRIYRYFADETRDHIVKVIISDGIHNLSVNWSFYVNRSIVNEMQLQIENLFKTDLFNQISYADMCFIIKEDENNKVHSISVLVRDKSKFAFVSENIYCHGVNEEDFILTFNNYQSFLQQKDALAFTDWMLHSDGSRFYVSPSKFIAEEIYILVNNEFKVKYCPFINKNVENIIKTTYGLSECNSFNITKNTSVLCNPEFKCSSGVGEKRYGDGGLYLCKGYYDYGICSNANYCYYSDQCDKEYDYDDDLKLSQYPKPFVRNGKFNATIIITQNSSVYEVLAASDIAIDLQYQMQVDADYLTQEGRIETVNLYNQIPLGSAVLANEFIDTNQTNLIIIGNLESCINNKYLMHYLNDSDCRTLMLPENSGVLKFIRDNNRGILLIVGRTGLDAIRVARVLAEQSFIKRSDENIVFGTDISSSHYSNIPNCNHNSICEIPETFFSCQDCIKQPPLVENISDMIINETDTISIAVNASDQNDDNLTYFINNKNLYLIENIYRWNTTTNDSGFYDIIITVSDGYFNVSKKFSLIIHDMPDMDKDNIIDKYDMDNDNDGVNDTDDRLLGYKDAITTSTLNISLYINGSTNIHTSYNETNHVIIYDGTKPTVEFDFDFLQYILNLYNISIDKQANESYGLIILKGLNLPENATKVVYIDHLTSGNSVCIKDADIASVTEISSLCNGENESPLSCPGINNNYNCTLVNNSFRITGLHHSAVQEQSYCGDGACNSVESCSSCSSDCGVCPIPDFPTTRSGGGGGACNPKWNCSYTKCSSTGTRQEVCHDTKCSRADKTETLNCTYKESSSNGGNEISTTEGSTTITSETEGVTENNADNENQKTAEGLSKISGAAVANLEKSNKWIGFSIVFFIVVLGVGVYFLFFKKIRIKKRLL